MSTTSKRTKAVRNTFGITGQEFCRRKGWKVGSKLLINGREDQIESFTARGAVKFSYRSGEYHMDAYDAVYTSVPKPKKAPKVVPVKPTLKDFNRHTEKHETAKSFCEANGWGIGDTIKNLGPDGDTNGSYSASGYVIESYDRTHVKFECGESFSLTDGHWTRTKVAEKPKFVLCNASEPKSYSSAKAFCDAQGFGVGDILRYQESSSSSGRDIQISGFTSCGDMIPTTGANWGMILGNWSLRTKAANPTKPTTKLNRETVNPSHNTAKAFCASQGWEIGDTLKRVGQYETKEITLLRFNGPDGESASFTNGDYYSMNDSDWSLVKKGVKPVATPKYNNAMAYGLSVKEFCRKAGFEIGDLVTYTESEGPKGVNFLIVDIEEGRIVTYRMQEESHRTENFSMCFKDWDWKIVKKHTDTNWFKRGDRVKVVRKVSAHTEGWHNSWPEEMDAAIGKSGTIRSNNGSSGVYIDFDETFTGHSLGYPQTGLIASTTPDPKAPKVETKTVATVLVELDRTKAKITGGDRFAYNGDATKDSDFDTVSHSAYVIGRIYSTELPNIKRVLRPVEVIYTEEIELDILTEKIRAGDKLYWQHSGSSTVSAIDFAIGNVIKKYVPSVIRATRKVQYRKTFEYETTLQVGMRYKSYPSQSTWGTISKSDTESGYTNQKLSSYDSQWQFIVPIKPVVLK